MIRRNVENEIHLRAVYASMASMPRPFSVSVGQPIRTLEQNAKMWAMLSDVSSQVVWHGLKLTNEEWKDVFTASLKAQKVVPGIDGGFVVCGARTSMMSKQLIADLIELMFAFGAEQNVNWSKEDD